MSNHSFNYFIDELKETIEEIVSLQKRTSSNPYEIDKLLNEAKNQLKDIKILHSSFLTEQKQKNQFSNIIKDFENKIQIIDQAQNKTLVKDSNNTIQKKETQNLEILEQSYKQILEMENSGKEIVNELSLQKETLNKSRNNLSTVNTQMSKSHSLLNSLNKWWKS